MANWVILIVRGGIKIVNWVRRKFGNEEIWKLANGAEKENCYLTGRTYQTCERRLMTLLGRVERFGRYRRSSEEG